MHDGRLAGQQVLMQVGFALGLEEGLSSVGGVAAVARVGYQDDTYLVGAASAVTAGFPALERALAAVGHRMRHTKCSAWAPACDDEEEDDRLPGPLRGLLARRPRARGGFKLLGGAVQGAMEVQITGAEVGMQPAMKRAARAAALANRIREFVVASPVLQAAHLAWLLLSKCVKHALSFDARLVTASALAPANGIVEDALWPAVRAIMSVDLDAVACIGGFASAAPTEDADYVEKQGGRTPTRPTTQHGWRRPHASSRSRSSWAGQCRGAWCCGGAGGSYVGWRASSRRTMGLHVSLESNAAKEYAASAWQQDQPISELGRLKLELRGQAPQGAPQLAPARLPRRLVSRMYTSTWTPSKRLRCGTVPRPRSRR